MRHHRRQRARPEPADDVAARHGAVRAPLARVRLARDRRSTATTSTRSSTRSPRRARTKGQPTMILARTIKGKGVSFVEGKDGWHGKAFKKGEELDRALAELEQQFVPVPTAARRPRRADSEAGVGAARRRRRRSRSRRPPTSWATRWRRARPTAPRSPSSAKPIARVVALDADVKNSTFSDKFEKVAARSLLPELHRRAGDGRRGDGARGARRDSVSVDVRVLPDARRRLHPHGGDQQRRTSSWPARTRACRSARTARRRWRSRISRCAARSRTIAVLYPCDAVSAERLVALMAYHPGPAYMRTSRPKTPVIYAQRRDVHRSAG